MTKHNRTTLHWTTHYPASLNVIIDAFVVKAWLSEPVSNSCEVISVVVDPVSNTKLSFYTVSAISMHKRIVRIVEFVKFFCRTIHCRRICTIFLP